MVHQIVICHDAGCQVALEGTCQEKTRRASIKIKENVLAHGKKIGPVDTQQADAVQTNIEAYYFIVDLRHTAVGLHETEQQ